MSLLFKLAWRNLWRNKRRSIITILAIFFAAMLSIAMRGLQIGTYAVNIENAVSLFSGYAQIQKSGFKENPSLRKTFYLTEELIQILNSAPHVNGFAPRVYADGLVSYKENSYGSAIFGLVPQKERKVSVLMDRINSGTFFASDSTNEIVVGYKLLDNLNANIGDRIVVLSQGFDGTLGNMIFEIVGTIKTGTTDLDAMAVFMGLSTLQELLAMNGRISVITVSIDDLEVIPEATKKLNGTIREKGLVALTWEEVMPELKQMIELDNVSGILTLAILVIVVAFGILNTVLMSVTERFREFGVSLAVGMPQFSLVKLVLVETFLMTILGLVIGNIAAAGINYYIVQNPIVFGGDIADLYQEYGFLPRMESSVKLSIFFNSTVAILIISLLSSVYPLVKVYLLEPLKGIRYT